MFQLVTILFSLAALVTSFWRPNVAVGILLLPVLLILFMYGGVKARRWKEIPELSPEANALFQKYGHFYTMPWAGRDLSGACSFITLTCMAVGAVAIFKRGWVAVGILAVLYFVSAAFARTFNPTLFLREDSERLAHDEILMFMQRREQAMFDAAHPSSKASQ